MVEPTAYRSRFPRGVLFPNVGFVQAAMEQHFATSGFTAYPRVTADLACTNPATGEHWIVEAKGDTKARGLDFNTGIGQLLHRMNCQITGVRVPRRLRPWGAALA